ncbi:MAG: ATP-binding protein [Anaerolineales bacterium]
MPRVNYDKLSKGARGEPSASIQARVEEARRRQRERLAPHGMAANADMGPAEIREFCPLDSDPKALLRAAMRQMHLSARGYHRVLKVSRTVAEALQYRTRVLDLS